MNYILMKPMVRAARLLFYAALIFLPGSLLASAEYWQAGGTVTGVVKDEAGAAVPGATIILKGTTTGTVTDMDGKYAINVGSGAVLVFSSIGYNSQEIEVNGRTTIDITLAESISALDEVVVVGYGVQEAKDVTGSVTKVEAAE